jgi:hypothetical protein
MENHIWVEETNILWHRLPYFTKRLRRKIPLSGVVPLLVKRITQSEIRRGWRGNMFIFLKGGVPLS